MEKICVAIRVRPPTKQTSVRGYQWKVLDNSISLLSGAGTVISGHTFAFDTIFGADAKNINIYEEHAKAVVQSAVAGFNGTVFAYGQTSSGKTYTMRGSDSEPGITRLAVSEIFHHILQVVDREYLIRVSYMEIYNEEINDLFAADSRKLQIHENLEKGVFVAGLREEIVDSVDQVLGLLEAGEAKRHFGETNMNLHSSRSHSIFRMVIESRSKDGKGVKESDVDAVRVSELNLVDLAGSERIAKTGAGGVRLKEGGHINKSLMCLGNVINKLCEGGAKQGAHIPYRDSKLTRILQTALGGNARTAIICTMTPDEEQIDESRGTLQFASRAKRVTNCAQVNEILTDAALLKRQKKEIEDLLQKLQGQGSTPSDELEKEIKRLRNDLLKTELEREKLEVELQEEKKALTDKLKEQERKIVNLSTMVISSAGDDFNPPMQKASRRETWCPRPASSDSESQRGSRRATPEFEAPPSFLGSSVNLSLRRSNNLGLPPAFGNLIEDDKDSWRSSGGFERSPTPADFENIADEDTWASLNGGQLNQDLFSDRSDRRAMSSAASENSNNILLEHQLRELQTQFEELQTAFSNKDLEHQQELETSIEEACKYKEQVDLLSQEKAKLEEVIAKLQQSPSPVTSDDYYVKKLEELVNEMEIEQRRCKQENARLMEEVQGLLSANTELEMCKQENARLIEEVQGQLLSAKKALQRELHAQTELVNEMEAEQKKYKQEVQGLKDEFLSANKSLQKERRLETELVNRMESEVKRGKQENARLVAEVKGLQDQLLSANTSLTQLVNEEKKYKQEVQDLQDQLVSAEASLQKERRGQTELVNEMEAVQKRYQQEVQALQDQFLSADASLQKDRRLQTELVNESEAELEKCKQEITRLAEQVHRFEDQLLSATTSLQKSQADMANEENRCQQEIQDLREQLLTANTSLQKERRLQTELVNDKEVKLKECKQENARLLEQVQGHEDQLLSATTSLQKSQTELANEEKRYQQEVRALEDQFLSPNSLLQKERRLQTELVNEREAELKKCKQENTHFSEQVQGLQDQLLSATTSLQKSQADRANEENRYKLEVHDLLCATTSLQKERRLQTELVIEREAELEKCKQENTRLLEQVQGLEDQLLSATTSLQKSQTALRNEEKRYKQELQALQDQLLSATTSLQQSQAELVNEEKRYKQELQDLQDQLLGAHKVENEENARLVEELQETKASLEKEQRLQTELEQEVTLLREKLNSSSERLHAPNEVIHECGFAAKSEEVSVEAIESFSLDQQLDIVQREKDRISHIWLEQMTSNEAEKTWLANELQNYIGALAVQDEVVSAICKGIREFEADVENRRSVWT